MAMTHPVTLLFELSKKADSYADRMPLKPPGEKGRYGGGNLNEDLFAGRVAWDAFKRRVRGAARAHRTSAGALQRILR
jgi:hypothetical protein